MTDRCDRCNQQIPPGESLCSACSEHPARGSRPVEDTDESRLWVVTVVAPVVGITTPEVLNPGSAFGIYVLPGGNHLTGLLVALIPLLSGAAGGAALYYDCRHVRQRDVEWEPSLSAYEIIAVLVFLTWGLAAILVTPYHLYRRKKAIGLPL